MWFRNYKTIIYKEINILKRFGHILFPQNRTGPKSLFVHKLIDNVQCKVQWQYELATFWPLNALSLFTVENDIYIWIKITQDSVLINIYKNESLFPLVTPSLENEWTNFTNFLVFDSPVIKECCRLYIITLRQIGAEH